jgi:predicted phosphodiesterase
MGIAFVHLSDIHFGQERGGQTIVDDDVKASEIDDCSRIFSTRAPESIGGILVTGDIAYAGQAHQYQNAGEWLDKLTSAIKCKRSDVYVVPGNHDIDRKCISEGCRDMLTAIVAGGDTKLDSYLASEGDKEQLFNRFKSYRLFAEAYDCSLDSDGGLAGNHAVELTSQRKLRFVGLNSALISGEKDKKGHLLLGKRQRVIPRHTVGEELVVLMHHPLDWLQDSADAGNYLRSRARVVLSGHEHSPSAKVLQVEDGTEILMLSAGATVPPETEGRRYCFNVVEFSLDAESQLLSVTVTPRAWSETRTCFVDGTEELGGKAAVYSLVCQASTHWATVSGAKNLEAEAAPVSAESVNVSPTLSEGIAMDDDYSLLVLAFFRDIDESQRLKILVALDVLPKGWVGTLRPYP